MKKKLQLDQIHKYDYMIVRNKVTGQDFIISPGDIGELLLLDFA